MVVSARPSANTVGFYRGRGFVPVADPLPELLALEPQDVHQGEAPGTMKKSRSRGSSSVRIIGGDLLSREVALRVPSALAGLTSLFGMGRGVSLPV
jgi:hypothetical protein